MTAQRRQLLYDVAAMEIASAERIPSGHQNRLNSLHNCLRQKGLHTRTWTPEQIAYVQARDSVSSRTRRRTDRRQWDPHRNGLPSDFSEEECVVEETPVASHASRTNAVPRRLRSWKKCL